MLLFKTSVKKIPHLFTAVTELLPAATPWLYVRVPEKISEAMKGYTFRGKVPIKATIGHTTWETSFMPFGKRGQIIPIPRRVRVPEGITAKSKVTISFSEERRKILLTL